MSFKSADVVTFIKLAFVKQSAFKSDSNEKPIIAMSSSVSKLIKHRGKAWSARRSKRITVASKRDI